MKKIFLVSLAAVLFLVGAGCTTTQTQEEVKGAVETAQPQAQQATIKVVADAEEQYTVEFQGETSALALLQKASSENGFEVIVKDSAYGKEISKIGDKTGGDEEKYWMYYVNGEMAMVGAAEYVVQTGDVLEFKFEGFEF